MDDSGHEIGDFMVCLHCGYCCKNLLVVIVVDPKLGIQEDNLKAINCLEEKCPHLQGDKPGNYKCAIHNEKWYPETPCFQYTQIGREDSKCRMGEYLMKNQDNPTNKPGIL